MIRKDRKIYLKLVNSLVGFEFRLECWISVVQAAASNGDDVPEIVRNWLDTKFDDRVISKEMTYVWPPRSPDLSPLDFWFWGHAMHHLKTTKPLTIEQLMVDVNNFASQLDQETVKKAVKDIISRAGCCLDNGGSAFESKLKAYKRTG